MGTVGESLVPAPSFLLPLQPVFQTVVEGEIFSEHSKWLSESFLDYSFIWFCNETEALYTNLWAHVDGYFYVFIYLLVVTKITWLSTNIFSKKREKKDNVRLTTSGLFFKKWSLKNKEQSKMIKDRHKTKLIGYLKTRVAAEQCPWSEAMGRILSKGTADPNPVSSLTVWSAVLWTGEPPAAPCNPLQFPAASCIKHLLPSGGALWELEMRVVFLEFGCCLQKWYQHW